MNDCVLLCIPICCTSCFTLSLNHFSILADKCFHSGAGRETVRIITLLETPLTVCPQLIIYHFSLMKEAVYLQIARCKIAVVHGPCIVSPITRLRVATLKHSLLLQLCFLIRALTFCCDSSVCELNSWGHVVSCGHLLYPPSHAFVLPCASTVFSQSVLLQVVGYNNV